MQRRIICLLVIALSALAPLWAQEGSMYHSVQATALVADPDQAATRLDGWVRAAGGYTLLASTERIVVRFPNDRLGELRLVLEEISERIVQYAPRAVDLAETLLGLESGIRSREEILRRNLEFLDKANVEGTLAIEREVTQLLAEIEGLKGRLRKMDVDRRFALAAVQFRFSEQTLPEDVPSSFAWINTVDFYAFARSAGLP